MPVTGLPYPTVGLLPERLNSTYKYLHAEVTLDKMMGEVRANESDYSCFCPRPGKAFSTKRTHVTQDNHRYGIFFGEEMEPGPVALPVCFLFYSFVWCWMPDIAVWVVKQKLLSFKACFFVKFCYL